MDARTGEKIGWIGGWCGGFAWILILAIVRIARGMTLEGLAGLALFVAALGSIFFFAPWRFPATRCWKLLIPLYAILALSVGWAVWAYGGWQEMGLNGWSFALVLPLLTPFGTLGRRRWNDGDR